MSLLERTRPAAIHHDNMPAPTLQVGSRTEIPGSKTRTAAAPAAVFLAGQAIAVGMLAWLSHVRDYSLIGRLTAWDGNHFLRIAAGGYTYSTSANTDASPAFLPGYPSLVAGLHTVTGMPLAAAAIALSVIAGVIFAYALPHIVRTIPGTDRRVELITVALVAISPMSIVFAMAYSEAMFCALAGWALVFALRHRWWPAGTLGFLAGLVRISGLALAAAFAVVAIVTLMQRRRNPQLAATTALPPAIAAIGAAAGTAAWFIYSGLRMGSPTAWFTAQDSGWGSHFDFGVATTGFIYRMATTAPNLLEVATAAIVIAACVLWICTIRQNQPILLLAYGAAAVAEVVGSAGLMNSKIRLLVPVFTLLVPIATWLSRLQRSTRIAALAAITTTATWLSAYSLTIWQYAI